MRSVCLGLVTANLCGILIEPAEAAQCRRSIGLIEERLGVACAHFAYPRAIRGDDAAEAIIRDRFRSAVVAGGRPNPWSGADLHRLTRTPIHGEDPRSVVQAKAAGGLRLEGRLREGLDRGRYRERRASASAR